MTSSLEYLPVNFIVGWNILTWSKKVFSDSSPCSQIENMPSMYLHQIIGFIFKSFQLFPLKISGKRNSVRRRKLRSNNSFNISVWKIFHQIQIYKTILARSAKVSLEICLISLVSKNL